MNYTLRGARLVDALTDLPEGGLTVVDGQLGVVAGPETTGPIIDLPGAIVAPGFIDVHTHGGGGCNLHSALVEEILTYARWVPATGVTSFLIGVVGTPFGLPETQLATAAQAMAAWHVGAEPLGIHLEGPFINERRRGAHLPTWLRLPDAAETLRLLDLADGTLRLITLAPELPGAAAMIHQLVAAGVTVSIGHTDASYEQTVEAIHAGVTHMTHCCNAMRPLNHRDTGPLGALAQSPQVFGEIIADGVHVHPAMVEILFRLLGPDRAIVITDALAGAGMPEIPFDFAGQQARVEHGVARLDDGTITGSVLTMDQALRNILQMTDATLSQAIGMITRNPARSIRVAQRKGLLQPGYDADLVILDNDLRLGATICGGKLVHASGAWREVLAVMADAA